MITQERLKELLNYNPETGLFTWLGKKSSQRLGRVAGTPNTDGYTSICVDYRLYLAHRLAFLYMTGEWPKQQVDHINHSESDNRWCNLRDVSQSVNKRNSRGLQKNNKSGFRGVYKRGEKYRACTNLGGKTLNIGTFHSAEEAYKAYTDLMSTLRG